MANNSAEKHRVDPTVARMFGQKFPGVQLEFFGATRRDNDQGIPYLRDIHSIGYFGKVDDLLRFRIVEPFMLPKWPKRKLL